MEEQIVEILQAVKEVTPEIAAQAVAYGRWCDVCWMAVSLVVGFASARVGLLCCKHWDEHDYVVPAFITSCILAVSSLVWICSFGDLIGSFIAPDYFAAEAIIDMLKVTK